jgi:hypothetical protein
LNIVFRFVSAKCTDADPYIDHSLPQPQVRWLL